LLKRSAYLIGVLCLAFIAVSPAQGAGAKESAGAKASGCGQSAYSYAGLQSNSKAHGVSATLLQVRAPSVIDGHVGGWVGVGGTAGGPNGAAEWIQVGFAAFDDIPNSELYYEVTVPGRQPRYTTVDPNVRPGDKHRVSVLEMSKRKEWWRVWVDGRPVSPPIHLPGSHGAWYPQAVAENWAGSTGACNAYTYRFSDVALASKNGGSWKPLDNSSVFEDTGYRVLRTAATPGGFVAMNL
jgi:hypothetical protein